MYFVSEKINEVCDNKVAYTPFLLLTFKPTKNNNQPRAQAAGMLSRKFVANPLKRGYIAHAQNEAEEALKVAIRSLYLICLLFIMLMMLS